MFWNTTTPLFHFQPHLNLSFMYPQSSQIFQTSCIYFGITVHFYAWMAHKFAFLKWFTKNLSAASCKAINAAPWNPRSILNSAAISLTTRWKGSFLIKSSTLFWYLWTSFIQFVCFFAPWFLGGLSLYLNHLIASHVANYDWPFGTLPFGLFCSNLDTRDLETYPRTYSGHFLKYVNFWRFQGHLSTFQKMGSLRKSHFTRKRMAHPWIFRFSFRRRGP